MNFIERESAQKLRGGYYTPLDLAAFLTRWVMETRATEVLEPSCGDGVFLEAFARQGFAGVRLLGFELDREEAARARDRARSFGLKAFQVRAGDFLGWASKQLGCHGKRFDAIVGNPPFVRYQYLPESSQALAGEIFQKLGLPFTLHTNAWVPFVLTSMALLRPGGRLAMVVPAEITHVTHAQSLRCYLGRQCRKLVIVDPQELWFEETLQGAVILLAQKCGSGFERPEGLGVYSVKGREFLCLNPSTVFEAAQPINGKSIEGKWTRAFLTRDQRELFDEVSAHKDVHCFQEVAAVDVGIVTGANQYFLVPDRVVQQHRLERWAHPMFGRSEHCPGVIYDAVQHAANRDNGLPTNFLWFGETNLESAAKAYIKEGEKLNLHRRFKCRVRSPWYTVPSVYATEIGMLKRCHHMPRLIWNRLGAYTTDTAYRIQTRLRADRLVASFVNPLTALSAELEGRHYGGGVLELIPSEIERLLIPLPSSARIDISELDRAVRTTAGEDVLSRQGKVILGALGFPRARQECILDAWRKLRDRRQRTSSKRGELSQD